MKESLKTRRLYITSILVIKRDVEYDRFELFNMSAIDRNIKVGKQKTIKQT